MMKGFKTEADYQKWSDNHKGPIKVIQSSHSKALEKAKGGKHVPEKAPSWKKILSGNPKLKRDSKGNVGY